MEAARKITDDISVLPSYLPAPGFGLVPVNAYVIKAKEPVLVDTGLRPDSDDFMTNLSEVIDPSDLRWLYLTHPDQDHVGSLARLMSEVPHLRLVTTFLGFGLLSFFESIAMDRVYLLNPGESLDVGDRTLTVLRPPTFDNPATTALFDSKSRALFSSDCFGAVLQAPAESADAIGRDELIQGCTMWTTLDSPWLHNIDPARFASQLSALGAMEPSVILSAHLPPAYRITDVLLQTLANVPDAAPFVGPNQAALEMMMASMTQAPAASVA
jgi:hypothetical protein